MQKPMENHCQINKMNRMLNLPYDKSSKQTLPRPHMVTKVINIKETDTSAIFNVAAQSKRRLEIN